MLNVSADAILKKVASNQYEISDEEEPTIKPRPARSNLNRDILHTPTFKEKYVDPNIGLLLLAAAYLFNSSMVVSTKVLEGDPHEETTIKPLQILLVRMAITYLGTLIYMFMYRETILCIPFGEPSLRKWLVLRGVMGFVSVFGTYCSLMYLSICDTILITFLEPSLIIILAWLILKEKLHKMEFLGCFISFVVVVLIVRPPFTFGEQVVAQSAAESSNPVERLMPALVALAGAFSMAGVYVVIRYIGNQVDAIMNVSYFALVTLVTINEISNASFFQRMDPFLKLGCLWILSSIIINFGNSKGESR